MPAAQALFIHGAPGDARVWTPVIDAMAAGRDARAITLSYFGAGEWPGDGTDFGTDRHARDIISYVEAAMEWPVTLVAWSFGCHPALLAAIRRPELFTSLALYEPSLDSYVDDEAERAAFAADGAAAFPPVIAALEAGDEAAAMRTIFDNSARPGDYDALSPARQSLYRDSLRVLPLLMGRGQPPAAIASADLARIACPVTVAMGEHTRAMFAVPSRAVAAAIPGAKLVEVAGAFHMLPETDPERFAGLVEGWLEDMT
ncbi:hypothetical protein B2G71_16760 [Novosphingobium sp. PC22D]|nr:hypothetical protein B2G71_16760 [Novosphingobium sp. PC22D]